MIFEIKYQCLICKNENLYSGKIMSSPTTILHKCKFCETILYLIAEASVSIIDVKVIANKNKIKEYTKILNNYKEGEL